MNKKNRTLMITGVTFALFMTEAVIHFNMGEKKNDENHKFKMPDNSDLIELGLIVGVFSLVNGVIIERLAK